MTYTALILVVLFLGVCVGAVALQVFLSNKESKALGLILPGISFGVSLFALFGVLMFIPFMGTSTITVNGEIVQQTAAQITDISAILFTAAYIFALYNIPTAVLLVIYAVCRSKRKRRRDLEIMSVKDLG